MISFKNNLTLGCFFSLHGCFIVSIAELSFYGLPDTVNEAEEILRLS